MSGINWKYNNDSKSRIFWSTSSDYYTYLEKLLIDFEFKFNQSLGEQTSEFQLLDEQIEFLVNELEIRIEKLLLNFNPEVSGGLTSISNEYKGKKYDFFIKMSENHSRINRLIKFHKFLSDSLNNEKEVLFWGGKIE
ncbi:hypothetical protein GCM10009430_37800 [Aquimarina litoralis]|uniref:Uncharacterized protein n=1 Tax=Aquimarina litoralis TaxID=584605 RepID=A0ABN1J4L1_9FLAO